MYIYTTKLRVIARVGSACVPYVHIKHIHAISIDVHSPRIDDDEAKVFVCYVFEFARAGDVFVGEKILTAVGHTRSAANTIPSRLIGGSRIYEYH